MRYKASQQRDSTTQATVHGTEARAGSHRLQEGSRVGAGEGVPGRSSLLTGLLKLMKWGAGALASRDQVEKLEAKLWAGKG